MKKQTKEFSFELQLNNTTSWLPENVHLGHLTISGYGYFYPGENPDEQIEYDIDSVSYQDTNIKPVLEWLYGSVKEIDEMHNATIAHLEGLFRPEQVIYFPVHSKTA